MKIVYYLFFVALFFSCDREKIEEGVVIKVADFQKELAMDSIVDDIKILELRMPEDEYIADVKDLAFANDLIYVLDDIKQMVYAFDTTGLFRAKMNKMGKARDEYINAFAIDADTNYLYLLDMPTHKVLFYDNKLNYVGHFSLPHVSTHFKLTGDGYVVNNVERVKGASYYYCMDSNHSITKNLFPYSKNSMQGADSRGIGGQILNYDKQNNTITMVEPFSDRVFELKDNDLLVKYTLKFEGNNIDHKQTELNVFEIPETYIEGYLDLKDKKIVSFLNDSQFYYAIFSDNGESVVSGRIVDYQTKLPFYVRWQYGDRAVGTSDYTCLEEYLKSKGLENKNDTVHNNMFLLFYKLK